MKKIGKNSNFKFTCKKCDYSCRKKSHWVQHIKTMKHTTYKILTNTARGKTSLHACSCGKTYKHRQSLYNHKKRCNFIQSTEVKHINKTDEITETAITETAITETAITETENDLKAQVAFLIDLTQKQGVKYTKQHEENIEIKQLMTKACETGIGTTNNNTNNNNITINMYLNDICKDAMFLDDFINDMPVNMEDLLQTHEKGYVGGIAALLLNNLKNMPTINRPIHCSDQKRNKFYVKLKNEGWTNTSHADTCVNTAVTFLAQQHMTTLAQWQDENPNFMTDEKTNIKWCEMVKVLMYAISDEECDKAATGVKNIIGAQLCLKNAMKDAMDDANSI